MIRIAAVLNVAMLHSRCMVRSLSCLALLLLSCSETPEPRVPTRTKAPAAIVQPVPLLDPPGLPAFGRGALPAADSELRVAWRGGEALLVVWHDDELWGRRADEAEWRLYARAEALEGLATLPPPFALQARGDGYRLAWARPENGSVEVHGFTIGADGAPREEPVLYGRAGKAVRWIEWIGDELLWELAVEEGSDLFAAVPGAQQRLVARSVGGWQALADARGTAVATVTANHAGGGMAALHLLEPAAVRTSPLTDGATALADIQLARVGESLLVAWTDVRGPEPRIFVAAGEAAAAAPLPTVEGQALDALVAGGGGHALLVWHPFGDSGERRLALVDGAGQVSGQGVVEHPASAGSPLCAADESGFGLVVLAPMRRAPARGEALLAPQLVRLDADLAVRAAEPLRLDVLGHDPDDPLDGAPALTRTLHCAGGSCRAFVTAHADEGAPLFEVELPERESPWLAPAQKLPPIAPPIARELGLVATSDEPIAALSVAQLGDGGTLVAWVTQRAVVAEGDDGATLAYLLIDASGRVGPVEVLSRRAISAGGVRALAVPGGRREKALLVWAAPNDGAPQVFATLLDGAGVKVKQKTVTRHRKGARPSEIFGVDAVPDGRGSFLCSWSDDREGDLEVYLARISAQLEKTGTDRRITSAKGASSEARLALLDPTRVMVAWSDARSALDDPRATGIYGRVVSLERLEPMAAELRLVAQDARARTPGLTAVEGGLLLSWIEQREAGASVGVQRLGAGGSPEGAARKSELTAADGFSASLALGCRAGQCRLAAGPDTRGRLALASVSAPGGEPIRWRPVAPLAEHADPTLAIADDALESVFLVEAGVSGRGARIRRLRLAW